MFESLRLALKNRLSQLIVVCAGGFFAGRLITGELTTADGLGVIAVAVGVIALVVALHTDATADRVLEKIANRQVERSKQRIDSQSQRITSDRSSDELVEDLELLAQPLTNLLPGGPFVDPKLLDELDAALAAALKAIDPVYASPEVMEEVNRVVDLGLQVDPTSEGLQQVKRAFSGWQQRPRASPWTPPNGIPEE